MTNSIASFSLAMLAVLVACHLGASSARACSCGYLSTSQELQDRFDAADAVFRGFVYERESSYSPTILDSSGGTYYFKRMNVHVLETLKGFTGTKVGLQTSDLGGFSGWLGREVLIYAYLSDDTGLLSTGMCSVRSVNRADPGVFGASCQLIELTSLGHVSVVPSEGPDPLFPPLELRCDPECEIEDADELLKALEDEFGDVSAPIRAIRFPFLCFRPSFPLELCGLGVVSSVCASVTLCAFGKFGWRRLRRR